MDETPESPRPQPLLVSPRFLLRPFAESDAADVQAILGDGSIAATTRNFEFPYPEGAALRWIQSHEGRWASGQAAIYAICELAGRDAGAGSESLPTGTEPAGDWLLEPATSLATAATGSPVVGAVGLHMQVQDHSAELGYWVSRQRWNQGVASEAVRRIVEFGFDEIGLHRIFAHHMTINPASGRVLQKAGFRHEGTLRQHVRKYGRYHDIEIYGLLAGEFHRPVH